MTQQLQRTLQNVEVLLKQANATFRDLSVIIAYVRNFGDLDEVRRRLKEQFGDIPTQVIVAPVCRPGWLVEVEGQAIVPITRPEFPAF